MRRPDLVPDCASCAAVCCIATSFDASEDFAFDKAAGVGCQYLGRDCRCAIHEELLDRGFRGCAVYDCFGAGPRVTRAFAGMEDCDRERNDAFLILRVVHEQLWLLTEAGRLCNRVSLDARLADEDRREIVRSVSREIDREIDVLDAIARLAPVDLVALDPRAHVDRTRALLRHVGDALGGRRRTVHLLVSESGHE